MKRATTNEKQVDKIKNNPHKSKAQTVKASRENLYPMKKS